jgi:DNA-binding transcriptional ArsR family regulator
MVALTSGDCRYVRGNVDAFSCTQTFDKILVHRYNISILAGTYNKYMNKIKELSEVFKALSDPTRLRLVKLLSDHKGALCVNALARQLNVTQSAVSQHLRVLRQAGLVEGERRGSSVHYSLDKDRLEQYKSRILETLGEDFVVTR